MKTYSLAVLQADDEEVVAAILEALARRAVIRFGPAEPWHTRAPAPAAGLDERIAEADGRPRLSFAEARQRLGL